MNKNWFLKLKYGKSKTPFQHYTLIAKGIAGELKEGFSCPAGEAYMGMSVWASSEQEASEMMANISEDIGFALSDRIQIYKSKPIELPGDQPHGYGINFHSFEST